jgi:hypothetical protein
VEVVTQAECDVASDLAIIWREAQYGTSSRVSDKKYCCYLFCCYHNISK